jgi:hypothetical protein
MRLPQPSRLYCRTGRGGGNRQYRRVGMYSLKVSGGGPRKVWEAGIVMAMMVETTRKLTCCQELR